MELSLSLIFPLRILSVVWVLLKSSIVKDRLLLSGVVAGAMVASTCSRKGVVGLLSLSFQGKCNTISVGWESEKRILERER